MYIGVTLGLRFLFPQQFTEERSSPRLQLLTPQETVTMGRNVPIRFLNFLDMTLLLPEHCPSPPVLITREEEETPLDLSQPASPCISLREIPPRSTVTYDLGPWKYAAFPEPGSYRITLLPETRLLLSSGTGTRLLREASEPIEEGDITITLRIRRPGPFTTLFRAFISKPLFNTLVLIGSVLPGHSLGWSIILLTLLVKLLLLLPSQRAIEGQKKLQAMQPKIELIKERYRNDQKKITEETMKLWRAEGVNPFRSCLPTLLQIPLLLGLFFVARDASTIALSRHLLYPPLAETAWNFTTEFLGTIELTRAPLEGFTWSLSLENVQRTLRGLPLPLLIGLLQFLQMKLAFRGQRKTPKDWRSLAERIEPQVVMLYALPLTIVFVSAGLPTAVSLYWGASTVFAVGQQIIVNHKK
jgi:YidC/Oxa1 family membrane protein insertase